MTGLRITIDINIHKIRTPERNQPLNIQRIGHWTIREATIFQALMTCMKLLKSLAPEHPMLKVANTPPKE